ncbi:hypothetical protein F4678DRAFT_455806 [Xylaria arbuscula]|nr:hypothetical protein F4678DRAFT_455806 [Xylaria arbuscula]
MLARQPAASLATWVKENTGSSGGLPPADVADVVYHIASRNDKVPLWLPLTTNAATMIKTKLQGVEEPEAGVSTLLIVFGHA